jgi:tRNA-uridine 2-sulfurtransferase
VSRNGELTIAGVVSYTMKVIVGMSGGVDSSVAAYLLKTQGYEVEGVSFILDERTGRSLPPGCFSTESVLDAEKSAARIGIAHTVANLKEAFSAHVIDPFIDTYMKGLTPNPCILCNARIKFSHLRSIAEERDAEFIATGHYARIHRRASGQDESGIRGDRDSLFCTTPFHRLTQSLLMKGIDTRKDQSYVLYMLTHDLLDRLLLPLGVKTKDEVREIAGELGLPSSVRADSQEICFVGGRDYGEFLENVAKGAEGPIIEAETGRILGRHKGIHLYTIGQRRRLGIASGRPLYVVKIDPSEKAVYVGTKDAAMMREFVVEEVNWMISPSSSGGKWGYSTFRATVKIRSMMRDEAATLFCNDQRNVHVLFDEPQWAPAPGQSAVFYHGEFVIGGGVIAGVNVPS